MAEDYSRRKEPSVTAGAEAVEGLPRLWADVLEAPHRLLALDYDGTLAPFHVDPRKAVPLPGVPEILEAVRRLPATTLVVISGRPVKEVAALLGGLAVTFVGSHGFERLNPDGRLILRQPSPTQRRGLEEAGAAAARLDLEQRLERKIASLALHTRPLDPEAARRAEERIFAVWSRIAESHELECRRFNGGVEIRSIGRHKGDALLEFLDESPEGTFAVYVGDDDTDEDAFRAIEGRGAGIRVGPREEETAARGFLPDCSAVKAFLESWLRVLEHTRPHPGERKIP